MITISQQYNSILGLAFYLMRKDFYFNNDMHNMKKDLRAILKQW